MKDIIVIGGGAGGLAAALKAHEEDRDVFLVEREDELGGILGQCIHNGFGLEVFDEEYTGPEYADIYIERFLEAGIDYRVNTTVTGIKKHDDVFTVITSSKEEGIVEYESKVIIMTTGCYEKTRGAIQIPGDRPSGVLTAGIAQRYININGLMPGKKAFVLGSGDIGLIMARRMRLEGAEVLGVAEILPYSNGLNRNIVQCLHDFDIPLYLSHTVTDIIADDNNNLKQIIVQKVDDDFKPIGGSEKTFDVDVLLLAVGLIPEVTLIEDLDVDIDPLTNSVSINQAYETSVPGLFVAGNALQVHDLVDKVTKESERAGLAASASLDRSGEAKKEIHLKSGNHVGYVTPQRLDLNLKKEMPVVALRSKQEIEKAKLIIRQDGKEAAVFEKRLTFVLPAEMTMFEFPLDEVTGTGDLTVDLEVSS